MRSEINQGRLEMGHTLKKIANDPDGRARWECRCGEHGRWVGLLPGMSAEDYARLAFVYHAGSAWNDDGTVRE
jgi:hypothetical protein